MSRESATKVVRRKLTRRDLFKAAPVASAAAATVGLGLAQRAQASVTTKGVCRFCLFHCGIEVTREGDRITRVQGDLESRTRGFLCLHGYALPEVVHDRERLRYPMVRVGDVLHEVSWDEALGVVADKLAAVKARWGAQALVVQTGWPLVRHPLPGLLHRFARAYGSPNVVSVASLCESSLRMGQALTAGSKYPQDLGHAKTLVLWGANPERSAPAMSSVLLRRVEDGSLIVIDPTRTALARRASVHLQVRPGSDGALALGLAHVMIEERLYDAAFVAEHVTGFEGFAQLCARYPPAATEALTTVKARTIIEVARRLARERPARVWAGLGVEHHECGVQTVRAITALEALGGAFDESWAKTQLTPPGENFGNTLLPALYRMATPQPVPPPVEAKPLGYDRFPLFEIYNREAQGNLVARAVLEDDPYPVRALLLMGANPVVTAPGATDLRRAADRLDLLVTADPFMSSSARLSDVVLPACTFAEAATLDEGARGARRNDDADTEASLHGVIAPQHEARPDYDILRGLAHAMGLGHYFPWATLKEALAARHVPFMADPAHQPKPKVAHSARFSTPTGTVELHSTLLEQHGYPPQPEWSPPSKPPTPEWPLLLVSGPRDVVFINSQFRGAPSVRSKQPEPLLLVHPSQGIADRARVDLVTELGRLTLRASVTTDVHPDSVVAPFGWADANVNALLGDRELDPISGFPALRSTRCRLEPASPQERGDSK